MEVVVHPEEVKEVGFQGRRLLPGTRFGGRSYPGEHGYRQPLLAPRVMEIADFYRVGRRQFMQGVDEIHLLGQQPPQKALVLVPLLQRRQPQTLQPHRQGGGVALRTTFFYYLDSRHKTSGTKSNQQGTRP